MISKNEIQSFLKTFEESKLVKKFELCDNILVVDIISNSPAFHQKKKLENLFYSLFKEKYGDKLTLKCNFIIENEDLKNNYTNTLNNNVRSDDVMGINNILAISSTKGGVGKSTIAANIALVLSKMKFKVGILDTDIYGPSIPVIFKVLNKKPNIVVIKGEKKIEPIESYGIKLLSIGCFIENNQAVVWRGPMATKVLFQMFKDTYWGELDFLILDLPPGTGDIHLSIVQRIPITGVVVVSTPQFIALEDVKKGINMFQMKSINVPILGIIQNMSYFISPELPNHKYYIFGKDGVKKLSKDLKIFFLGEIPILQELRESMDIGVPIVINNEIFVNSIFKNIVKNILKQLIMRNTNLNPTEVVKITNMSGCLSK